MEEKLMLQNVALEKGSLIFVTGGSGLVGSHVIDKLLGAGYGVRAATRRLSSTAWMQDVFKARHASCQLEIVEVPDMLKPDAYDGILKGVSGIIHLASPIVMDPNPSNVIPQSVNQVRNILAAAASAGVKRFVLTSSSTAITTPKPNTKFHVEASKWNDVDVEAAWAPPPYEDSRSYTVYAASKTSAEKEAYNFMKTERPSFVLNSVLPDCCFGTTLHESLRTHSTSAYLTEVFGAAYLTQPDGSSRTSMEGLKAASLPPQWFVDVEDVARLHLIALLDPDLANERILAFAHNFNWTKILNVWRTLFPNRRFVSPPTDEAEDIMTVDDALGRAMLKKWYGFEGWTSFERTMEQVGVELM